MITPLFSFSPEVSSSMTLSEKLSDIFNTAVIGFAVVFTVLGLIWIILEIFGKIFAEKTEAEPKSAPVAAETEPQASEKNQYVYDDNQETVAAIMAAISAYSNKPISSFRVVSFRRTNK